MIASGPANDGIENGGDTFCSSEGASFGAIPPMRLPESCAVHQMTQSTIPALAGLTLLVARRA